MAAKDPASRAAWLPYSVAPGALGGIRALKAVSRGDATPEQQKQALDWIVYVACQTYGDDYRTDPRDHAYTAGRRAVGLAITSALTLDLNKMKKDTENG